LSKFFEKGCSSKTVIQELISDKSVSYKFGIKVALGLGQQIYTRVRGIAYEKKMGPVLVGGGLRTTVASPIPPGSAAIKEGIFAVPGTDR
jgi:hypothetical protein